MSELDFVITSKFHGVVFSHLLAKPVLALSYHRKIADLMRAVEHSQYCINIESCDIESLKKAFTSLVENAEGLKSKCRQATSTYATALKGQFDEIFLPENLQLQRRVVTSERKGAVLRSSA